MTATLYVNRRTNRVHVAGCRGLDRSDQLVAELNGAGCITPSAVEPVTAEQLRPAWHDCGLCGGAGACR